MMAKAEEHGGDVFGASVPELGDLDGGVAASVLLGDRVVERAHRLFDLGAVGHGGITTGPALCSIPWLYSSRLKHACCPEGRSLVSSPPNRSSIEPQSGRRR